LFTNVFPSEILHVLHTTHIAVTLFYKLTGTIINWYSR